MFAAETRKLKKKICWKPEKAHFFSGKPETDPLFLALNDCEWMKMSTFWTTSNLVFFLCCRPLLTLLQMTWRHSTHLAAM